MGWLNRLCIRQLNKALPIAVERLEFAQRHSSHGTVSLREAQVDKIKAKIQLRIEQEQSEEYRRLSQRRS